MDNEYDKFLLYMDTRVSEKTREKLSELTTRYPEIEEELFNQTKNAMVTTILSWEQSIDYIKWVTDTLKYMRKFFK